MSTEISSVSHLAYVASSEVISVPSSPFPASGPSTLILYPHADPASLVPKGSKLTSLLLPINSDPFVRLLPALNKLKDTPVIVHVSLEAGSTTDLEGLSWFKESDWVVLVSKGGQETFDQAVVGTKLAKDHSRAVLHVFPTSGEKIEEVEEAKLKEFIEAAPKAPSAPNTPVVNGAAGPSALFKDYSATALASLRLLRRPQLPFTFTHPHEPTTLFITLSTSPLTPLVELAKKEGSTFGLLQLTVIRPLEKEKIKSILPKSVKKVVVLEQTLSATALGWGTLRMDVENWFSEDENVEVFGGVIGELKGNVEEEVSALLSSLSSSSPITLGTSPAAASHLLPHVPTHEGSYTKILTHLFASRLEIANTPELGNQATLPEYALGKVRSDLSKREKLAEAVKGLMGSYDSDKELVDASAAWMKAKNDTSKSGALGEKVVELIKSKGLNTPASLEVLKYSQYFTKSSQWIIGSDAWSYDLGSSGIHQAISSGANVNILIIDSLPYSQKDAVDSRKRKKDIGLYAMNYGNTYVASIAVYSSYSQVLQSLNEADQFDGPSVVLAYLPYKEETCPALEVLKETKVAVDTGYWPLYRWNPRATGETFSLDSEKIKEELKEFLDRQNHLSQLTTAKPSFAPELVENLGDDLLAARKQKAADAFSKLVNSMDGPPLLVLYASDGGAAEKVAKRLANRAGMRGLACRCIVLDEFPLDDLKFEKHVAFISSTAGQGEAPQNARITFKKLAALAAAGEKPFGEVNFSVFGMGDSHYWPRAEDAHYYNKPGKDLDARLEQLGAQRFADLGLGDDQDADGAQTGYKAWESKVWKALGVDSIEILEKEPEPITNENIKIASNYLRGTIAEGLKDTSTGALAPSDGQLTKFHGIYEQDDRDIREERKAQGLEPAYSFMVRVRLPGGVCTPEQWLAMDQIADEHGNGTLKLTTRQTWQYHGIIKSHLKPAIQDINKALLDTIAACGDVNRNVQCSANPTFSHLHKEVHQFSIDLSEQLLPSTSAYAEIWLDKKKITGDAVQDFEPLYGKYYLPRKFKIAVAVPPHNDVDVFTNDVGFIAIVDEKTEQLLGFNVTAGGGMGVTHSNTKTYPRLADVLGFVTKEQGVAIAQAIMLTQRDNGNRADRKNARLKYTIDRMGLENFKAEVEKRFGSKLEPARPYKFVDSIDHFGWSQGHDGAHHFTMFIENGRVQDEPELHFKTGLREIAKVHKGKFRLTANQHLILSDIPESNLAEMKALLAKYKLDNLSHSALRLSSSACVAFPTCGLAMAESERYLPLLVTKVEEIMEENGLRNDSIVMRMTGCPNGCARPWPAEIAFVGKAPGAYMMMLGGGFYGQRLSKIYKESVTEPEIMAILRPMIKRYALERLEGEHFGDFVIRVGIIKATTSGKEFYKHSPMDVSISA